jgi:hypothetical protein
MWQKNLPARRFYDSTGIVGYDGTLVPWPKAVAWPVADPGLTANRRIEVMTAHRSALAIAAVLIAGLLFVLDGKTGTLRAQTYSNPPPPCPVVTTGAVSGAARGAARGTLIGAISGNAGRGAAIGAAVGGIGGAARRATARANGACY